MASSMHAATSLRSPATNNGKSNKQRVTFASPLHTSILIPASEFRISPKKARERMRALRTRRATPHKSKATRRGLSYPSASPGATASGSGKKPRLVESGAVRVQIAKHTNPRRSAKRLGDSGRLIDQGAVRLNITRHTTPRRIYATRSRIWSPPPPSSKRKVVQSEKLNRKETSDLAAATATTTATTPSRSTATTPSRSNAHRGGHRFRAALTPTPSKYSTPIISREMCKENGDNVCLELEKSLSRTLFD